jgi:hypothetical protein
MDAVSKALDSFLDQKVEARAIFIIKENGLAAVAAQDHVIERPGIVNSWLTSHGATLHNKLQLCKPDPINLKNPFRGPHAVPINPFPRLRRPFSNQSPRHLRMGQRHQG